MTTIVTKNGSGAPLASDLVQGELAVDLTNKRLYTEDSGGTVIEIGTSPSTIDINAGTIDGTVIGGSSAAAGTFTTFTSTGIDDNATSTAITIDAGGSVLIGKTTPTDLHNTWNHLIIGEKGAIISENGAGGIDGITLTDNAYIDADTGTYAYQTTAAASKITQSGGVTTFSNAASGTAGTGLSFSEAMRIDSNGNVGIGTSSPSSYYATDLVVGASTEGGITVVSTPTTGAYLAFADGTTGSQQYEGFISYGHTTDLFALRSAGDIQFMSGGSSERMRIDSSGNVGIGTTSPDALLNLEAFQNPVLRLGSSDGTVQVGDILGTIEFYSNDTNAPGVGAKIYAEQEDQNGAAEGAIVFETGVTGSLSEIMRLNSDGLVGIGTASPASLLHLSGSSSSKIIIEDSANPRQNYIGIDSSDNLVLAADEDNLGTSSNIQFRVDATERMRIDSSGNLLVGTTVSGTPTNGIVLYKDNNRGILKAATTLSGADAVASFYNPNGKVGQIVTNGSTTAYQTSSDQRLKENIVDAPAGNIDAIRVRSFDWKADGSHQTYGMVAQELVDVAPEAVSQGETEDDMWGVDYSKLVPMMIKEIQDLKAEVAALKGA